MKHWSHIVIFLLALLAIFGFGGDCIDDFSCNKEQKQVYDVLRCEGDPPGHFQAYSVETSSASIAERAGGLTTQYNPLNGKACSVSTDGKGRPFTVGEAVVYASSSAIVNRPDPSTVTKPTPGKQTSAAATPIPSLVDWFPFLAPLISNPSFPAVDSSRYKSSCTSAVRSYLVNHLQGTVTAFGVCPLTILKEITVAPLPLQIRITPDGATALVTSYDEALTFIDTATNTVKAIMPLVNYNPQGIAISPDGTRAYVTHYYDIRPVLLVIDIPNRKLLSTIALPQPYPRVVVITPDGSQAWVNYLYGGVITVVDVLTGTVARNINISQPVEKGMAFNPTGTKAYAAVYPNQVYVIDTATLAVKTKLTVGQAPNDIVATPDGTRLFVNSEVDPGLWWIDPTIDRVVGSRKLPGATGGSMGLLIYQ